MNMLRISGALALALGLTTAAACGGGGEATTGTGGGGNGTTSDTTSTTSGPFTEAPHPALPQVENLGGPVLKTPKVQAIVYASDPHAPDVDKFLAELTKTTYWSETTSEYGVGPLTILPTITISDTPPASLDDATLQQTLAAHTSGINPDWGTADPSTIYMFVIPQGTMLDAGGLCCQDYDGYHDEASVGTTRVPYAVTCACPGIDGPNVNDLQQLTVVISHELVEAATDPFVQSNPAYGETDLANIVWTITTGGEVADMCEFNSDSFIVPQGSTYMIQRSWSNKAAMEGKNPCVPSPYGADPFFNAAPVMSDMVQLLGVSGKTTGVSIPVGMSKTIDVQLYSSAPTKGPIKVTAYDYNDMTGGTKNLDLTLDKDSGVNGDVLHLTIKVNSYDSSLKGAAFALFAELDGQENMWMGTVGQ
jgi:hypothetical protein